MIDYWKLARDFKVGDVVQRLLPWAISAFVGRVVAVHKGTGFADVMWPHGVERHSCEELVRVKADACMWLPPEFDGSYSAYDMMVGRAKEASEKVAFWRGHQMPRGFYTEAARAWNEGASEVETYNRLWHRFAAQGVDDEMLQDEVAKFYRVSERLGDLRIHQHVVKTAAYWVAQNRQYRVSQGELTAKKPNCPKCGTMMRRTTYKMQKGARVRLFACPKDLFLIKTDSILGPLGEPVGW